MSLTDRRNVRTVSKQSVESTGTSLPVLFSIDVLAVGDDTVLTLHGELDIWTQRQFTTALDGVGNDVDRLVLDLSDLTVMDIASIGILHQRRMVMEAHGHTLVLRSPNGQLRRILEITGMIGDRSPDPVQHRIVLPLPASAYERSLMERI